MAVRFRLFRSRLAWLIIGVLTVAGTAYWLAVAITAVAVGAWTGATDPAPADIGSVAGPVGLLATSSALALLVAVVVIGRRYRDRRWVLLREQMLRDATTDPGTHVAQVLTRPNSSAGGHVQARDLISGYQGPLYLPGRSLPRNAVVCFTHTPHGGEVRAWMTQKLWRATSREASRIERRTAPAQSSPDHDQPAKAESQFDMAAADAVAEAESILRQLDQR